VDGEWRDLVDIQTEIIKVKGQPDEIFKIGFTHRGPIVSSKIVGGAAVLFGGAVPELNGEQKFSFGWGLGQVGDDNFNMLRYFIKNKDKTLLDLPTFLKDTGNFVGVGMNLALADVAGNIAYAELSPVPKRKNQTPFIGSRVLDGTTTEFDWAGWVAAIDLPYSVNPEKGYIVTANNRQTPDNAMHDYGAGQMSTGRAQRIDEAIRHLIDSGKKLTLKDVGDI